MEVKITLAVIPMAITGLNDRSQGQICSMYKLNGSQPSAVSKIHLNQSLIMVLNPKVPKLKSSVVGKQT